jgi:hypothetical protein
MKRRFSSNGSRIWGTCRRIIHGRLCRLIYHSTNTMQGLRDRVRFQQNRLNIEIIQIIRRLPVDRTMGRVESTDRRFLRKLSPDRIGVDRSSRIRSTLEGSLS